MASHTYSREALNRAVTKHVKKTYDRIELRLRKDSNLKQEIEAHAEQMGESVNAFMIRAAKEAMERDGKVLNK